MNIEILLGVFNISIAIVLCISLYRGRNDKILKLTLITAPVTTVRPIVIAGKGFTFITVGWGITAILLIFSGWRAFFQTQMLEQTFLITVVCVLLILIIAVIAHYLTPNSHVEKSRF